MALHRRIVVTRLGGSDGSGVDDNREYSQLELAELIEDARFQVSYFVDVFDAHSKQTDKGRLVEHYLDANAIIHAFTRALRAIRKLPLVVRNHPTAMVAIMGFEVAAYDISHPRSFTLQELLEQSVQVFQPGDIISTFTVDRWHSVRRQLEIAADDLARSRQSTLMTSNLGLAGEVQEQFGADCATDHVSTKESISLVIPTGSEAGSPNLAATKAGGTSNKVHAASRSGVTRSVAPSFAKDSMAATYLVANPTSSNVDVARAVGVHPSCFSPSKKHKFPIFWRAKSMLTDGRRIPKGSKFEGIIEAVAEPDEVDPD